MTFSFHPEALKEYREAVLWYEQQKAGLGGEFATSVEAAILELLQKPTHYAPREKGIRRYALKRFPYHIRFVYDEARLHVVIYAVMHVRRDPNYWHTRVRT
jgi:plasmid stabilization system protein ParE